MAWSGRSARVATLLIAAALTACRDGGPTAPGPSAPLTVPAIAREFRGMWIATVANIDWPSTAGLSVAQQQAELAQLLSVAEQTGLNAVVLQVRAAGDALFPSTLEPWSRSLTGTQGGDPGYDPLAWAVAEAHQRGLELHAWFNPFRAGNLSDTLNLAATHLAKRRPDLARAHCTQLWFDPGEAEVRDHAIEVILDVVRRYGVDAVQMDDYFYPYPDARCPGLDFPDSAGYARYLAGGGSLSRADWRRANVNGFVERLYGGVRAASPTVRVGISPFGIWRPGNPSGITGLDAYAAIYADSRLWLQQGWADYFAPQLYWAIASTGQSFPALLTWWGQQNTQRRHLWPGLASYRVSDGTASAFAPGEIPAQIGLVRQSGQAGGATGTILYNASSVRSDRGGFAAQLATGLWATGALPPATTWLDAAAPSDPTIAVSHSAGGLAVTVTGDAGAYWWLVRWRSGGTWLQRLVPAAQRSVAITTLGVDGVAVTAINRVGNASGNAVWRP
uniref:Glycosyl hydrolase-like 10 domain-containing protein n=1 Tax=uncultured Gemmatimonadetes bacterium Rifle_16ft_4_minimus_37772 TaxID=1665097 RepID=A0A0H4T4U7_9BACT|nr:hypothetical protein [uncultured Gemmatimonadetes bacterium Rifle_16ft_4_minimus_37772]